MEDPRGQHLTECIRYISAKSPRTFVLENVTNLTLKFNEVFEDLLNDLRGIGYHVDWKIMNTMKHGGVPQDRARVFIVGIDKAYVSEERKFKFPKSLEHEPIALSKLLEHKNKKVITSPCKAEGNRMTLDKALDIIQQAGINPYKEACIIDIDASPEFAKENNWQLGKAMTITAARGGTGFYCTTLGRRLCISEMLRLQGFRPETVSWEEAGVARTRMGRAIGNAMSCCIMERLLPRVLWAGGLISEMPVDKWEDAEYNPF